MGKLNVIGLGYIGLPTALMFAKNGVEVIGTDFNKNLVETLNQGKLTFKEEGLEEVFTEAIEKGIEFKTTYESTNRYIVTVPTPYISETKKIDVKYVINAVNSILDVCEENTILVIESTISPGTINKFIRPVIEKRGFKIGVDIHLVHAPERIIPGNMIKELENNSRTIGADSNEVGEEVKSWYKSFCKGEVVITNIKTAEMSKVVENTFRDINIAFANELAKLCDEEGMDVYELIKIANKHPRVNILQPGPGVGGHCISVDPWFLVGDYPDIVNIIKSARVVNDSMPKYVFNKIHEIMRANGIEDFSRVGIYGLTYKENVDDMRESPALQLISIFENSGIYDYKVYDPYVNEKIHKNQVFSLDDFLYNLDLVVVLVNHQEIINNERMFEEKIIYDTRNVISIGKQICKL